MCTDEDFDAKLEKLLDECSGADLLAIPGLYEVVSEHFNNEILAALATEKREREETYESMLNREAKGRRK